MEEASSSSSSSSSIYSNTIFWDSYIFPTETCRDTHTVVLRGALQDGGAQSAHKPLVLPHLSLPPSLIPPSERTLSHLCVCVCDVLIGWSVALEGGGWLWTNQL
ncbi:unnamed protein product [Pleuronectes platessa]|uniref:Uncharacterized protein n=1 Tax=Pleuronectes platessa TaxID=8262 RepID=A0A9N7UYF5_PLEPL|nr:unnamed protein product [Pleuronectes platessa]